MTTPWWAWVIGLLVMAALIGGPTLGVITFDRRRAEHVKHAEIRDSTRVEHHVVEARLAHPEIVRVSRIDRNPWYLLIHVGVFCYAVCIFTGAKLTSNVMSLGGGPRFTMGLCFLVGSTLVITSALLGTHVGWFRIMPSVFDHPTADVLGDDVVLPYRIGMAGMGATATSSFIYSVTSFQSTTGSLGGWLTGMVCAACIVSIPWFFHRTTLFNRHNGVLIADAKVRLGLDCSDVDH